MKKILLFMFTILVMVSCSKEEAETRSDVMVNVTFDGGLASPTLVRLYNYDEAKDFDRDATTEMGFYQRLVDKQGNKIIPEYTSDNFTGVNTFENVEHGKYLVVAMYKPDGYSFPMFYYYAYKTIEVNDLLMVKIDFEDSDMGKFIEF